MSAAVVTKNGDRLQIVWKTAILIGLIVSFSGYLAGLEIAGIAGRKLFFSFVTFTALSMIFVAAFRIVAFTLLLIGCFVCIGDVVTELSGGGTVMDTSGVSPEAGEAIFWGKGQCHTCHKIGGTGSAIRCPDLAESDQGPDIGIRAGERIAGMSAKDYLIQSLVEPDAYTVDGFGKGNMPKVWRPPIALTGEELAAVIAFLQSLGGEVDIYPEDLPPEVLAASATPPVPYRPPPGIQVDPVRGEALFHDLAGKAGCVKCHTAKIDGGHEILFEEEKGLTIDGAAVGQDDLAEKLRALRAAMEREIPLLAYVSEDGDVPDAERAEIEKVLSEGGFEPIDGPGEERPIRVQIVPPTVDDEAPEESETKPAPTVRLNDEDVGDMEGLKEKLEALRPQVAAETRFRIYFEAKSKIDPTLEQKIRDLCETYKFEFTVMARVGPDLTGVAARQPWEYLLESILDPSAAIAAEFQQHFVTDIEDTDWVGVIQKETDEYIEIVEIDDDGNPRLPERILKDEIESRAIMEESPMPGNLKEILQFEEIYNILQFLLRLK
ncbi:MAG: hypothetical protein O7H41_11155 [Planctomycetota bacterium]|nr:hypothetical protein [Planctomycetota bacterium]